ncbi:hypothetical protein LINGRAHAP2_LOCUS23751 [Linum grandiflorum]
MLDEYNVLAQSFRQVRTALQQPENQNLRLRLCGPRVPQGTQYALPTGTELAGLTRITSVNPLFDSLHFPLLFPYGNDGFHNRISYNHAYMRPEKKRLYVTQPEYYCFRLQYRSSEGKTLIRGGKALQHFCIDAFTTVEQNRLLYLRDHQKELRSEAYMGLNIGRIILPSSFIGGMRYMKQLYLVAICYHFGNPDIFITFTIQKRGLPHAHILVWLKKEDKLDTVARIDQFISAELPNPAIDPIGYATATKFMLHGPCGNANPSLSCMEDGKCNKYFPKAFTMETSFDEQGYVVYKRRDTGITAVKSSHTLDNGCVVPYNRNLIVKYQAHINVEICHKGQLIKYLFKYITKGPYRSSPIRLIASKSELENTMLTQWFNLNRRCISARKYTYDQIPNPFVFNEDIKDWTTRKKGFAIGRIPSVPIASGDVFYMRMLLGKVCGALSFEDLRTYNGVLYPNYQQACQAMGILASDDEWNSVMLEVSRWATPFQIRSVFVSLLIFSELSDPNALLQQWWESMSEDFAYRQQQLNDDPAARPRSHRLYNDVLIALENLLHTYSSSLNAHHLPMPDRTQSHTSANDFIGKHLDYNHETEATRTDNLHKSLNSQQLHAYTAVMNSINGSEGKFFFLHGHGGTEKTFLYNCIVSKVRSQNQVALVVASSDIAATLLPDGVIAHSRFKIPIEIDHLSTCSIKKGTDLSELLKIATLIVWDEAPMIHRYSFEAVDKTLCDIMDTSLTGPGYKPFGGKTVLLGGDFRQTLPVLPNGGREDNINASLPRSYLWNHCTLLHLSMNMRINSNPINHTPIFDGKTFPEWVLSVGNGTLKSKSYSSSKADWITIPETFLCKNNSDPISEIINKVYPAFVQSYGSWNISNLAALSRRLTQLLQI